jgi:hypothetical protein
LGSRVASGSGSSTARRALVDWRLIPALLAGAVLAREIASLPAPRMATGVVPSLAIALSTLVVGASSSAAGTGASALGRVVAGARALWPSYALAALGAVIWRLNVDESAPLALASIGLAMLAARSTLGAAGANAPRAKAQVSFAAVVWITFVYFACGQQLRGSTTNDAAYYFGMARHFAERARFGRSTSCTRRSTTGTGSRRWC